MRKLIWLGLVAACGSKASPKREPLVEPPKVARIALVEVPAEALGAVRAASYLTVAADGALAIGKLDTRGEVNVSALAATPTEDLSLWGDPSNPPVPPSADALADAGILGGISGLIGGGSAGFGDSSLYGGLGSEWGEPVMVACGAALHLDARLEGPTALLIPDAKASATVVLEALGQMPRPVALVARGNDPRGLALRLIVDSSAVITTTYRARVIAGADAQVVHDDAVLARHDSREQTAVAIDDGATAQDLLEVLAGLATAGVKEVVLDRGVECADYTQGGGFGFGGDYDHGGMWGDPPEGDGWGSIGHGSGTGTGYGSGGGGSHVAVPRVEVGAIDGVSGDEADQIRENLETSWHPFHRCYEQELATRPDLGGGTVIAKLRVEAGKISVEKISGFDADLTACLQAQLLAMEFPYIDVDAVSVTFEVSND